MKQLSLSTMEPPPPLCFGGSLGVEDSFKIRNSSKAENSLDIGGSLKSGNSLGKNHHPYVNPRRAKRPLSSKHPIHMVLKAQKNFNLYKNKQVIQQITHKQAKTFGIKIYGFSIQLDHIHFSIRIFSREMYKRFIRAVTGLIARKLRANNQDSVSSRTFTKTTKLINAHKNKNTYKVWKVRPFTRIVSWGKAFQNLKKYILQNEFEIHSLIPKQPRKCRYKTALTA